MILLIVIFLFVLILFNSIHIIPKPKKNLHKKKKGKYVNISIVIAARNESPNVLDLIKALKNLDYSPENFEVVIVDDNSTDDTFALLKKAIEQLENYSVYRIDDKYQSGKRNALSFGINKSKYSFILTTDADCRPKKNWLQEFSDGFKLGKDFLIGIAPYIQKKSLVNKISCFENLRSLILTFSLTKFNVPYTAAARNFGFSKSAFQSIGGYENTTDTISGDDDLLLREAVKNKLKIGTVTGKNSFVLSNTKSNLKDYLDQRARHTQSSLHYLLKHKILLGGWHLLNLFFLISPFLFFIDPFFLLLLPAKVLIDVIVILFNQEKFSYGFTIFEIIYLQLLYEILLVIHFFNANFRRVRWK